MLYNNRKKTRKRLLFKIICLFLIWTNVCSPQWAIGAEKHRNESDMQDILESGGYGAVLGAAMGLAILPFVSGDLNQNIRIVAGGASLGFMFGSAYGFYDVERRKQESYNMNYYPKQTVTPPPTLDYDPYTGESTLSDPYLYSMPYPNQGANRSQPGSHSAYKADTPLYHASLSTPGNAFISGNIGDTMQFGMPQMTVYANRTVSVRLLNVQM